MLPALQHRVRAPLLHPQPLTPVSRPPREAEIPPRTPLTTLTACTSRSLVKVALMMTFPKPNV